MAGVPVGSLQGAVPVLQRLQRLVETPTALLQEPRQRGGELLPLFRERRQAALRGGVVLLVVGSLRRAGAAVPSVWTTLGGFETSCKKMLFPCFRPFTGWQRIFGKANIPHTKRRGAGKELVPDPHPDPFHSTRGWRVQGRGLLYLYKAKVLSNAGQSSKTLRRRQLASQKNISRKTTKKLTMMCPILGAGDEQYSRHSLGGGIHIQSTQ